MHTHWLSEFTGELRRIAPGLDEEQAAEFVRKVYETGREDGRQEADQGREHAGW